MIYYKEILREYEKDREAAHFKLTQRLSEIYQKIPRIEQIDKELSNIGIKLSKAVLSRGSDALVVVEDIRRNTDNLLNEKEKLLFQNGFTKDYLTSVYRCELCQDNGFIESKPCKCFKQKFINKSYAMSNLSDILKQENFDYFDIRFYSEEVDPQNGASPRANIKKILSVCMDFANNFDKQYSNLLLYGKSGLGKTFLCNCIAKELLDKGKTVLYVTAFQLFKMIEHERFNKEELEEPSQLLEIILTVDLLIIDDLGTEFATILSTSELFNFINNRLLEKKNTIISTNLSPSDFISQYSDRIVSRIQGNYKMLKFFGDDIRIKKKYTSK